jgi:hypothetical protein
MRPCSEPGECLSGTIRQNSSTINIVGGPSSTTPTGSLTSDTDVPIGKTFDATAKCDTTAGIRQVGGSPEPCTILPNVLSK